MALEIPLKKPFVEGNQVPSRSPQQDESTEALETPSTARSAFSTVATQAEQVIPGSEVPKSQRVHVLAWYVPGTLRSSCMPTLGSMYLLHRYLNPLGTLARAPFKEVWGGDKAGLQLTLMRTTYGSLMIAMGV